jgi:3-dehydroquinate dehydratase-2
MLGTREPDIYGAESLDQINESIKALAVDLDLGVAVFQSNGEADIVDRIQESDYDLLIINPAAYTHTSIVIRDALTAVGKPVIEVHLSNIHKREEFRRNSFVAGVAVGQISGFGPESYLLALRAARTYLAG